MFARYAALVKNLRGVVAFDLEEEGVGDVIRWLVSMFKYRNLGLPPTLIVKYGDKVGKYLGGKPFREIVYPVPELEKLSSIVSEEAKIPYELSEGFVLASTYISPLLVLGSMFVGFVENLAVETVRVCGKLDVKQWKLHLRIADYTVFDFYEKSVLEAMQLISKQRVLTEEELNSVLEARLKRIREDTKRYWRIKCSEGKPFLYYVDMLNVLKNRIKQLSENHSAALSIIPVIHVAP